MASILGELLNPIMEFLKCLALWFLGALEWLALTVLNLLIFSISGLISVVLLLLPEISLSGLSSLPFLAWVNYLFPVEYFVTLALLILSIEFIWWVVSIALRWGKAV